MHGHGDDAVDAGEEAVGLDAAGKFGREEMHYAGASAVFGREDKIGITAVARIVEIGGGTFDGDMTHEPLMDGIERITMKITERHVVATLCADDLLAMSERGVAHLAKVRKKHTGEIGDPLLQSVEPSHSFVLSRILITRAVSKPRAMPKAKRRRLASSRGMSAGS